MKNLILVKVNRVSFSCFRKNITIRKLTNKQFSSNLKSSYDISINNKKELNPILNYLDILNLPKYKIYKAKELELLKKNMIQALENDMKNPKHREEIEKKLIAVQHLLINYEKYEKLLETISNNIDINPDVSKNSQKKIEIIKKDDRFIINLNDLAQRYIYLGVIFNKRIRAENPDKVNNLVFLLTL